MRITKEDNTYRCKDYKLRLIEIDVRVLCGHLYETPKAVRNLLENAVYYRLFIGKRFVEVTSLEMGNVDDSLNGLYDDLSDLPDWMQERIAMLNMLSFKPPTETVDGVGRRISEFTYWVQRPDPCA